MNGPAFHGLRLIILLIVLTSSLAAKAVVLDPPSVRCASVNVVGDVSLTWVSPPDPGGDFLEYRIFVANDIGGPYIQLATVPVYGQVTYFHAGANADLGARYYYMTTVSDAPPPNESVPSDTLATMFLEVAQSAPLGNAVLTWNAPTILPTTMAEITVWLEYPLGNWMILGTVPNTATSFTHVVSVCSDSLTFRLGLGNEIGCISYSSRDGDVFEDTTPPTSPTVATVTVDTLTGLSNIIWEPSPEGDTDGYIIVLQTPGGGVIIDTVYGQTNNTYEWGWSTPETGPESFTVAAFDSCQVGVPPSPNTSATRPAHSTVHVTTNYDRCSNRIFLNWSPYVGWDVSSYQILLQIDGGPWATLVNVPSDQTTFTYTSQPGRNYCFIVKAVKGAGSAVVSFSNETCRYADHPALPDFNYLRLVTVTEQNEILVVDSVDMNAEVSLYTLERSANGGVWQTIATANGQAGPVLTFIDADVDPDNVGYRYRIQVRDSCGGEAFTSNIGGNILLRATADLRNYNRLEWNGYADWAGTPVAYQIHRSVENEPFEPLALLPPLPLNYDDDVQDLLETTGRFCYQVQAIEGGNPSGINATSESNIQCAIQEELVYIPNAFVMGGYNHTFIPVIGYVDVSEYELSILNRWGQVIWTTTDRNEGWNGTIDSEPMPTGVYFYYCSFHNGAGRRFEERGHVTLLTAFGY